MSNSKFSPHVVPGFHCVGWVKSAHGLRGEIYVQLNAKKAAWLSELEVVGLTPTEKLDFKEYAVEVARPHKDGLILQIEGVSDRNHSELLRKQSVYIPESLLTSKPGEAIYLKAVLNFQVIDQDGVVLGEITGFASNGAQDLLRVQTAQGEALIPFVEAFIQKIDSDRKVVEMNLPPGLFDQ